MEQSAIMAYVHKMTYCLLYLLRVITQKGTCPANLHSDRAGVGATCRHGAGTANSRNGYFDRCLYDLLLRNFEGALKEGVGGRWKTRGWSLRVSTLHMRER